MRTNIPSKILSIITVAFLAAISSMHAYSEVSAPLSIVSFGTPTLTLLRAEPGAVATMSSTYPAFIEFSRTNQTTKGSIGALGSFEMNMSANMNYADGVHRLYDKTKSAYWLALSTQGLFMQFSPPIDTNGDVWDESGKKYAFVLTMTEASFRGDVKPLDNGKTYLGGPGMAFKGIYIDSTSASTAGAVTINKSAGRVKIAAGQTSVIVTNDMAKTASHVFANVSTKDASAKSAQVTPADGSFEVTINAPTNQEVAVDFFIVN